MPSAWRCAGPRPRWELTPGWLTVVATSPSEGASRTSGSSQGAGRPARARRDRWRASIPGPGAAAGRPGPPPRGRAPGIVDGRDRRVPGREPGERRGVGRAPLDPEPRGADATKAEEGVERRQHRAQGPRMGLQPAGRGVAGADHHRSPQHVGMTGELLAQAVEDDVCSQLQRAEQEGGGEGVVDHRGDPRLPAEIDQRGQVQDPEQGVADGLGHHRGDRRREHLRDRLELAVDLPRRWQVDDHGLDTEGGERPGDQALAPPIAGTEQHHLAAPRTRPGC